MRKKKFKANHNTKYYETDDNFDSRNPHPCERILEIQEFLRKEDYGQWYITFTTSGLFGVVICRELK